MLSLSLKFLAGHATKFLAFGVLTVDTVEQAIDRAGANSCDFLQSHSFATAA